MSKKTTPDHEKSRGASPAAGASFNPRKGRDEATPEAGTAPRSVTHGVPIPESEYKKLKEEAGKTPRSRTKKAQVDPSTTASEDDC
jgi:hypothetical protein